VHFDRTFVRYEQHDDGTVTAFFADGTSATADLLVAADGTHSAIRGQYLPHARLRDAGSVSITTGTPLTDETVALLPEHVRAGISLIFGVGGMMGALHVMELARDRARAAGAYPPDPAPRPLYDNNTRDYVNLIVWTTGRRLPADVMRRRGKDLVQLALGLTRNWHPNLRELLHRCDPASAIPIEVSTSEPIPRWESSTVTLLGDAVHTMTPGRGVGANTALRDAALLCRHLIIAAHGHKTLLRAVADYEAEMLPYGFARVADSLRNNGRGGDDPLYKPVIGRLKLVDARGFFGVRSRVPRLRRRFVDDLYSYRAAEDAPCPATTGRT
jgi:2-polyprenyl-6-methoxyphenol hydroxylase-like FAD-dependent oxidoreductase